MERIPEIEPDEFTAGETLEWRKSLDDFPASDWTLKYYFRAPVGGGFDATAAADGDDFSVSVAAPDSLAAGAIYWQAWVEKGGEKHLVAEGNSTVKASLAGVAAGAAFDGRSRVKKILDAIDAMMEGKATRDQQEYQIGTPSGNRMLRRIPIDQLISLRRYYAGLYAKERRRAGGFFMQTIETRFDEPR